MLEGGAWPFQRLCDQLCVDVLDPRWEVRHGASVALREVLRGQAAAAGVVAPLADQTSGWCSPGGSGGGGGVRRAQAVLQLGYREGRGP